MRGTRQLPGEPRQGRHRLVRKLASIVPVGAGDREPTLSNGSQLICNYIDRQGTDQWTRVQQLFPLKTTPTLQFEARKAMAEVKGSIPRRWSQEECLLLKQVMEGLHQGQHPPNSAAYWNQVARSFFEASEQALFRSSKQCR